MEVMSIVWLALFVGFLLLEAATVSVVSIWFAVGALAAMVASLLVAPVWLQILIFVVVSAVFLLLLRPVTRKVLTPRIQKTNVDAVVGTVGVVTEEIDNISACGQVKLGAMVWTARSTAGDSIAPGTQVCVDKVEGVKVYVTPVRVTVNQ